MKRRQKEKNTRTHRIIFVYADIGRTLIEINLDIYSRRSAGYVGHCTSINAPTRLQLHPGSDITSELIICDRSTAHVDVHLCFAFTCRGWIRRSTVWRMARGIICKSNNLLEFGEIKLAQSICKNYKYRRSRMCLWHHLHVLISQRFNYTIYIEYLSMMSKVHWRDYFIYFE